MAQGSAETAQHLSRFLSAAVQWLAIREESKKVLVTTSRALFSRGEAVELQAQVYDATNRPVDQARVTVRLHKGTETTEVDLRPAGNGRYEGSVDGLTEGEYTFRGTADAGDTRLGEDGGSFSVGGLNLEFQDTRMNAQLLRELVGATGGKFVDAARIDSLIPALRALPTFVPRQSERGTSHGLWDWPVVLGTLLVLLSTEWILRKRSGML